MATLNYITGGPGQAIPLDGPQTGGNLPPQELVKPAPPVSNPLPPNPVGPSLDPTTATGVVNSVLSGIVDPSNPLIANARRNGLEFAQTRGLINSSIAAGNAERAALDSAMPLVGQALDIFNRREGESFQLGRDRSNAQLQDWLSGNNFNRSTASAAQNAGLTNWLSGQNHIRNLAAASHQAGLQDWMANQQYTREFNGTLSMLPIMNSFQLNQLIAQYALENPQTYPPSVVSGLTNFLNQNMFSILKEYFPNLITAGGQ